MCVCILPQLRDFTGAVTLLEFNRRSAEDETLEDTLMWLGYCSFHLGNYQRAIDAYKVRGFPPKVQCKPRPDEGGITYLSRFSNMDVALAICVVNDTAVRS